MAAGESNDTRVPHEALMMYRRSESAVFRKTKEAFGGLSNMAARYPLVVEGVHLFTSEALYQACRFPHQSDIQRLIIEQASPMSAKMKSKPYRKDSRPDWDRINITVMRWCLQVKLAQHWERFGELLQSTGDLEIVEESARDQFWGARPAGDDVLVGRNVLGQLLMELRERLRESGAETMRTVEPPGIPEFLLYNCQIGTVRDECADQQAPGGLQSDRPFERQLEFRGF